MKRRQFLQMGGVAAVCQSLLPALCLGQQNSDNAPFAFGADGSQFLLHQKPFQIRSGEMHPARIPHQYWLHRIQMARAMGMNTIAIYVIWNFHESREGEFDFDSDSHNIAAFIRLCQQEKMWVLLRAGPYICGEWDNGGIPTYLLASPDIKLRANAAIAPRYMTAASRYIAQLATQIRPLMVEQGGPILMVQIENEFGSYGSNSLYLEQLRAMWQKNGINGPFYTQDGLEQLRANKTSLPGCAIGLSGGELADVQAARKEYRGAPVMSGELYPGWLTHWGEQWQGRDVDISKTLHDFMRHGISFNLYVIHGGSNFGFSAGANTDQGKYQPDVTSYDYAAPINEQGRATPAYFKYRNLIAHALGNTLPAVPATSPVISRGAQLLPVRFASLWDNLPEPICSAQPKNFEELGQNQGLVLYRHIVSGGRQNVLQVAHLNDYATVFLDGGYAGGFSRVNLPVRLRKKHDLRSVKDGLPLQSTAADSTLEILVEGMGHVNYGRELGDTKGLIRPLLTGDGTYPIVPTGWQHLCLPLDAAYLSRLNTTITDPHRPGLFFKLNLHLDDVGDTYIDMRRWCKGMVWVNGHNLGRYWELGPQHRLYCPAPWLKQGDNEIIIFDLHQVEPKPVTLCATLI